ncbi:MAG: 5-formyltetrahydrofolate cyclo-ligase [Lentimonas sp.]|jgi:5-formyltetrahydrofolate cyclo-ligase
MTKKELRELYKEKRRGLSPGELGKFSDQIVEQVLTNFQLTKKLVSLFLPIERKKEVNTYILWEKILSIDGWVAVPKINKTKDDIKHVLLTSQHQLKVNELGIPEPQNGKIIAAHKIDIVFVPLLCVDKLGNRVGYGGGFYDRFLKKCNPHCKFIGLSVFPPIDKIKDVETHDIKLHACITPEGIIRF